VCIFDSLEDNAMMPNVDETVTRSCHEGYNEIAATKAVVDAAGFLKAGSSRKPFRPVPPDRIRKLQATFEESFSHFLELGNPLNAPAPATVKTRFQPRL
jgi:hypothetical protein